MAPRSVSLAHEQLRMDNGVRLSSNRAFGFALAAALAILATVSWRWQLIVAALAVAGIAMLAPRLLSPVHWLAFRIALVLHHVLNPILMAILFFLLLTPLGLLMRVFGRQPLALRRQAGSYWLPRDEAGSSASMKVPF